MPTFKIECQYEFRSPAVTNISAPTELAAIDRAFDLAGVIRAHSLGQTRQPAAVVVSFEEFERTQEQPLASVLAELRAVQDRGRPQLMRRQAD